MSPLQVYIVQGDSGDYSDYTCWNVAAYLDKAEAEAHVALLQAWETRQKAKSQSDEYDWAAYPQPRNPYDPVREYSHGKSEYVVVPLALSAKAPKRKRG